MTVTRRAAGRNSRTEPWWQDAAGTACGETPQLRCRPDRIQQAAGEEGGMGTMRDHWLIAQDVTCL